MKEPPTGNPPPPHIHPPFSGSHVGGLALCEANGGVSFTAEFNNLVCSMWLIISVAAHHVCVYVIRIFGLPIAADRTDMEGFSVETLMTMF